MPLKPKEHIHQPGHAKRAMHLAWPRLFAWICEFWERFWPRILPFAIVISIFLSISWIGLWPVMGPALRWVVLGLLAIAALVALFALRTMTLPRRGEVDSRIERASGLRHRPVTAQEDARAHLAGSDDPFARALWKEHRRRMASSLGSLRSGVPVPKTAARDPYALRTLVALLLFVAFAVGWGNWTHRITDAFRNHATAGMLASGRIDAWLTPPAYTNRPPIFLAEDIHAATVPEGSELVLRVVGIADPRLSIIDPATDRVIPVEAEVDDRVDVANGDSRSQTFKSVLADTAVIELTAQEAQQRRWAVTILPDNNPEISFEEDPSASNRGTLDFAYGVKDDYGVVHARAEIRQAGAKQGGAVPLVEPPQFDLALPRRNARDGSARTSQDLTSHPWAGAAVELTLIAEDEAGQLGRSETKSLTLPERIFTKPLALAVVEERRRLALDANMADEVADMLDIITDTHPEEFIQDISVFTALRVAFRSIQRNSNHDELREALDLLWETALAIEDGDLSLAERRLRDAQERLSKALENGASDEEIDELMKELRAAMDAFMRELAEQMARNPQTQQAMPLDPDAQILRQQDLDRLMKQIEDLAKSGSRDAARQLLQELQRMMNNLQMARPGQQQQRQTDEFSQQMNKLGEMMRKQQELMDQTFDMQRRQQQQGQQREDQQQGGQQGQQNPMTAEEFAEAMKELQRQQGELQRQMQEMQESLRGLGLEPGENLGEAGEAMGEAEQQLGQGETGEATGQQGRALQAMRQGAQEMMRNMQNQAGEQGRRGERGQHGQQSKEDRDPLGRQSRSQGPQLGNDTKIPGEIDAQRARRILEAIRRRLGETTRPKLELEYLDRLLPTR